MRADALRNQQRLLTAAIEQILEVGAEPSLDAIARRASLGIGTLYRHYPDREALLNAVAIHVLDQATAAAKGALSHAPTGYEALRRYMHAAFERGVGVLHIIHPLLKGPDWSTQRAAIGPLLEAILDRCKSDRTTRRDLHAGDIVLALIRFSRPITLGLPPAEERALARRHLDIYLAGLCCEPPDAHEGHLQSPPPSKRTRRSSAVASQQANVERVVTRAEGSTFDRRDRSPTRDRAQRPKKMDVI